MLFNYLMKKNLLLICLITSLFAWAAFASCLALKKTDHTTLIGIDANGTRIIGSNEDPLFKTEVVNFVRRFFGLLYNFDAESFDQNVGSASDLMSLELWKSQEMQVVKLGEEVKKEKIAHTGTVKSISKNADGSFLVILHSSEMYRLKSVERDLSIRFSIQAIERSSRNPWGMEVRTLDETKI